MFSRKDFRPLPQSVSATEGNLHTLPALEPMTMQGGRWKGRRSSPLSGKWLEWAAYTSQEEAANLPIAYCEEEIKTAIRNFEVGIPSLERSSPIPRSTLVWLVMVAGLRGMEGQEVTVICGDKWCRVSGAWGAMRSP